MPRRVLQGKVVSKKADKTLKVRVDRRVTHPMFGKIITRSKHYAVHDESNKYGEGDAVQIVECPPRSKTKTWEVVGDAA